jgi:2'-5' RNA ligase
MAFDPTRPDNALPADDESGMRLFFAVMIPESLRERVAQVQSSLRDQLPGKGISWVKPENFHYTVRFLGEQPEEKRAAIRGAAVEATAGQFAFTLQVGGLGVFPNLRRPGVLWIGTESGEEPFIALYRRLEDALRERSFPSDSKDFHAHLTLARIKAPVLTLKSVIEATDAHRLGPFEVNHLSLVLSELHSSGSRYQELARFGLGDA